VANFVEVYGRRRPVADIPRVTVTFGPLVVNGKAPKNPTAEAIYPKGCRITPIRWRRTARWSSRSAPRSKGERSAGWGWSGPTS